MVDDLLDAQVFDRGGVGAELLGVDIHAGPAGREHVVAALAVAVDPVLPAQRGHPQAVDQHDRPRRCALTGAHRGPEVYRSIVSGVSSAIESSTMSAIPSESSSGGNSRLGIAITSMSAAAADRRPLLESSTAAALQASTPSLLAAARYTSGAGLPRLTSSPETVAAKLSARPVVSSAASITGRLADEASPSRHLEASRLTVCTAPGSTGTCRW